jgi:ABC-type molybdenum transport system ATPase subunit/photorepair protein PhrA
VLTAVDQAVRDSGASVIFVTHHRGEMPECITHILRLEAGRVIEQRPRSRGSVAG